MQDNYGSVLDFQKQLWEEHLRNIHRMQKVAEVSQEWEAHVGLTPHDIVYQDGKVRLLHYPSKTKTKYKIPLLIVFSLINRSYILDLKPGKSIVEKMVEAGYDVYLIDWGIPGRGDQFLTLDDYVNRFMHRMVQFIQDTTQQKQVSMLGYCMGGTMAAMYASLYPEAVKNLMLMATPMDFSDKEGLLFLWADKTHFKVDKLVDVMGNIPPWFLQSAFTITKPMQNLVDKYVKFYENVENKQYVDDFMTLEYWLNDNIPLSGQVYKQFVEDCFHDNRLIQNKMRLGTHRIDLSNIRCPLMSIIAEQDHLVPPKSSLAINDVVSSKEKKVVTFASGHIGLSISGRAMKSLWPEVIEWLGERSEPIHSATK